MTNAIAPIVTVTPQQALGKAMARGVIVDSGNLLLKAIDGVKQLQIINSNLLLDKVKWLLKIQQTKNPPEMVDFVKYNC